MYRRLRADQSSGLSGNFLGFINGEFLLAELLLVSENRLIVAGVYWVILLFRLS
jgi:hypothetical protein